MQRLYQDKPTSKKNLHGSNGKDPHLDSLDDDDELAKAFDSVNWRDVLQPQPPPSLDGSIREKLDSRRFHLGKPPPTPRTIYSMSGKVICTPGNLLELSANNKTCKTTYLTSGFIAASFGLDGDTLGIKSENPFKHALIHFDSEQSPYHQYRVVETALLRVGVVENPEWLRSYRLADIDPNELVKMLECELHDARFKHGGIHSVLLDGVADFVLDVNSSVECPKFVTKLQRLAIEYDTVIICILHLNPGSSDKSRGHLGSQLERKAETVLRLTKDKENIFRAFTAASRNAPVYDEDGPCFKWSDEKNMHISCIGGPVVSDEDFKKDRLIIITEETFKAGPLSYSESLECIMLAANVKKRQAGNILKQMFKAGLIEKNKFNQWHLSGQKHATT